MQQAGYDEKFRKNILLNAIRIHDKMKEDHNKGVQPMNRPKSWKAKERRATKQKKRHSWSSKGGCIAPIFVPATPNGELARALKEIADKEAVGRLKFKILEMGGKRVKYEVQKSNPTATPGCEHGDCVACRDGRGKGGNCHKSNIQYELECKLCPPGECVYIGESSRNLYTRGKEHLDKYRSTKRNKDSFIKKH